MKKKKRIQQLEDRLDILLVFVNELLKDKHGVALMWGEDYNTAVAMLEAHDSEGKKAL